MPSFHSVARQQHLKQERKEKMNNQITLKQLLLVATTEDISVYLKDVNCMDIHTVDENWSIVIRGQKMA